MGREFHILISILSCFFIVLLSGTALAQGLYSEINTDINGESTVLSVIENPAFQGFGHLLFPLERSSINPELKLNNINSLLPYHSNIKTETTVAVINALIQQVSNNKTLFYNFYSQEEKAQDNSKVDTGFFFIPGEKKAPFAIICAGGGFSYVGSIHEGFPYALEIAKKGYNTFVLAYRVGSSQNATEDLAKAIFYIFQHAEEFNVNTADYSVWGSSAGARMAAAIGTYGVQGFLHAAVPKPATVVMAYTGHLSYSQNDPPTFAVVGENDGIANPRTMEARINALQKAGIDTEFHIYNNLGHGFGLGIGTSAEGWIEKAIQFWATHIENNK